MGEPPAEFKEIVHKQLLRGSYDALHFSRVGFGFWVKAMQRPAYMAVRRQAFAACRYGKVLFSSQVSLRAQVAYGRFSIGVCRLSNLTKPCSSSRRGVQCLKEPKLNEATRHQCQCCASPREEKQLKLDEEWKLRKAPALALESIASRNLPMVLLQDLVVRKASNTRLGLFWLLVGEVEFGANFPPP